MDCICQDEEYTFPRKCENCRMEKVVDLNWIDRQLLCPTHMHKFPEICGIPSYICRRVKKKVGIQPKAPGKLPNSKISSQKKKNS